MYEVVRTQGNAILKLKLENLRYFLSHISNKDHNISYLISEICMFSGTMIETTFLDEAANLFDKEAIETLPSPVIVAITSMKVTHYLGTFFSFYCIETFCFQSTMLNNERHLFKKK